MQCLEMSAIYTSSGRTHYSFIKRKTNLSSRIDFLKVGERIGDMAKQMESEIEIQRKLVFDSMMMVKSGILAKLNAQNPSTYASLQIVFMKTADDGFLKETL